MTSPAAVINGGELPGAGSVLAGAGGLELVMEMAHDLRSPLSSILVLAEALQNGQSGPVNEAQQRQLGIIYCAALSLCASASDVIELARDRERLVDQRPQVFSVSDVLNAVCDMVHPIADAKRLDLRVMLPAIDRRMGFERALTSVFLNLATNALKSTDIGYVELAVREIDEAGRRVECSVTDTGRGIEPAVLATLAEPHRESHADVRQRLTSAGMGLAMCRRLVGSMGSTLNLDTGPERGTRCWFEIPLPPPADSPGNL